MGSRRLHAGRREEIWARWRKHWEAQRASGQTQVAYCRTHGLDPRHFSAWKSKLRRAQGTAPASSAPTKGSGLRMVPVVIRRGSGAVRSRWSRRTPDDPSAAVERAVGIDDDRGCESVAVGPGTSGADSMLKLPEGARIFMAAAPIDMRRSFDGLCATVMEVLKENPLQGHLFLFRGKRCDRVKALIWDRNGLAIWYKRLEKGKYRWPACDSASLEISEQELALLLDGVDLTRIRRLPAVHAQAAL